MVVFFITFVLMQVKGIYRKMGRVDPFSLGNIAYHFLLGKVSERHLINFYHRTGHVKS